jgi:hypothetical protein
MHKNVLQKKNMNARKWMDEWRRKRQGRPTSISNRRKAAICIVTFAAATAIAAADLLALYARLSPLLSLSSSASGVSFMLFFAKAKQFG